jgi:hypothetical protein
MGKIVIRSSEFLKDMRIVDQTERVILHKEHVLFVCGCGTEGMSIFGMALHRHKNGLVSWRCEECVNKGISVKQSKKVGNLNPFFGKKHSEESIEKIKQSRPEALIKAKETNNTKYGFDFGAQGEVVQKKMKKTNQERYGCDFYTSTESFKEASKETLLLRYGVDNAKKVPEFIERGKETLLSKYGVDSYSKTEEFKRFMSDNHHSKNPKWRDSINSIKLADGRYLSDVCNEHEMNISNGIRAFRQYGEFGFYAWLEKVREFGNALEQSTLHALVNGNINAVRWDKKISDEVPFRPDFKINQQDREFYFNIDGLYWHSEKACENTRKHIDLRTCFENNGLRLFQFREDEIRDKSHIIIGIINSFLGTSAKIQARKCVVEWISAKEGKEFLRANHLMGPHNTATHYAIKKDGVIYACMSVRRKGPQLEISRFASAVGFSVIGGFSKILNFALKDYSDTKEVLSFCDLRYFTGHSYRTLGFSHQSTSLGWQWTDGVNTFNRLFCRANMDERKLTETEQAVEMGLYKIYDAGQAKFTKKL